MSAFRVLVLLVGFLCAVSVALAEESSSGRRTYEYEVSLYRKAHLPTSGHHFIPASTSRFAGQRVYLGQSVPRGSRYQLGRPIRSYGSSGQGSQASGEWEFRYDASVHVEEEFSWTGSPYAGYRHYRIPAAPAYGYYGYYHYPYFPGAYGYYYPDYYGHRFHRGRFPGGYRRPYYHYPYSGSYISIHVNW